MGAVIVVIDLQFYVDKSDSDSRSSKISCSKLQHQLLPYLGFVFFCENGTHKVRMAQELWVVVIHEVREAFPEEWQQH
jgi:hypothetical protein